MKKNLYTILSVGGLFKKLSISFLYEQKNITVNFFDKQRQSWLSLINKVASRTSIMLKPYESYMIAMSVNQTSKVNGAIAEIGVFKGGSAALIGELKGEKKLYLFDTFEGLPDLNQHDTSNEFHKGQFKETSFEYVKKLVAPFSNVTILKGYFPDTAGPIMNETFSLIHLDVDLHKTTKDALEFFYPRMSKGGIIISHDYVNADGVRKAFDDFFQDKPEPILIVSDTQCLIVKS
jgi:O-methyltransferase